MILAGLGLLLWIVSVSNANFLAMGPLGLVTVLGWAYFVGLGLVVIGFAMELMRTQLRERRLIVFILLFILYIFATACAVEPTAALTDAWLHAGFVQYIYVHGHVLNGFDSRFSWPGGFSLGAVLASFAGQANVIGLLRWFPPVIEALYLAPMLVITRFSGVNRRAGWFAVALFYVTNWIYQDYFSPQALNYLFFLVVLAVVLARLQPKWRVRSWSTWLRVPEYLRAWRVKHFGDRSDGYEAVPVWDSQSTMTLLGLLALLCLASAMSHQLTPYALCLALAACFVTRRLSRPELGVVAGLLAIGWLSLGASNFWVGHLTSIFGSVGKISTTIGSNVTSRVTGSAGHLFVVELRILLTAALYVLAGLGVLRRRPNTRTLEALAAAPFLLLAAQNYGGEGLLRVVLFGLPFTALLAASAIIPNSAVRVRRRRRPGWFTRHSHPIMFTTVVVVVLGFALVTTIVRGGNDAYESFSTGELSAVNYTYAHVRGHQVIGTVSSYVPFGSHGLGTIQFFNASSVGSSPTLRSMQRATVKSHPTWLILSKSQEAWGEIVMGYAPGWEASLESYLVNHGYQIVAGWDTATVLRYEPSA